jgi:hypothetical protein
MTVAAERVGPRRRLRSILAGRADDELARAFAVYHAELASLLGDPAATTLSKRGLTALAQIREHTLATRSAIAKVQPRIHEADALLRALASYSRGLREMREGLRSPLTAEAAERVDDAARLLQRSGKAIEQAFEELRS